MLVILNREPAKCSLLTRLPELLIDVTKSSFKPVPPNITELGSFTGIGIRVIKSPDGEIHPISCEPVSAVQMFPSEATVAPSELVPYFEPSKKMRLYIKYFS